MVKASSAGDRHSRVETCTLDATRLSLPSRLRSCAVCVLLLTLVLGVSTMGYLLVLYSLTSAPVSLWKLLTTEPGSEPINLHNLARFVDRLQRGLPVHVTAIGGSNMQGSKFPNNTVVSVLVEWLDEKFPVDVVSMMAEVAERRARGLAGMERLSHVSDNRAVGGTRSAMASYCMDRLVPPCDEHNAEEACAVPDLLLIDYSVNDFMSGNDVTSFSPRINIERLIRHSLTTLPHTAIIVLHFASWQRGAMR